MLLSDDEIKNINCVKDANESNYQCSNYYLSIGTIFSLPKKTKIGRKKIFRQSKKHQTYKIQPREMVWIVSNEVIDLPKNVTGVVTLVSRLTKQGLLALNAGIVDPTWQGPIGTIVVNFSSREIDLEKNQQFFRLLCLQHSSPNKPYQNDYVPFSVDYRKDKSREEYLKQVEIDASRLGSSEFLDIESVSEEVSRDLWSFSSARTASVLAVFAILLAIATAIPQLVSQALKSDDHVKKSNIHYIPSDIIQSNK